MLQFELVLWTLVVGIGVHMLKRLTPRGWNDRTFGVILFLGKFLANLILSEPHLFEPSLDQQRSIHYLDLLHFRSILDIQVASKKVHQLGAALFQNRI